MPRFELTGFGRETGRKRVRIYEAKDQEDAIMMAAADGTIVDTTKIHRLPESPPTERQLNYARDLGIHIRKGITKTQLSEMIDKAVDEDWPTQELKKKALKLGIKISNGITGDKLEDLIFECEDKIDDERERLKEKREDEQWDQKYSVQTIEQTGTIYKGMMLIGLLIVAGAIPMACGGNYETALILVVIGIVTFIVGKTFAWWYHG